MTKSNFPALLVLIAAVATVPVAAQQLEPNSPGGSLRSGGSDPIPGTPFLVNVTGTINITVGSNPSTPFALLTGPLATTSLATGINGQFFDLNVAGAAVVGDALGGSGAGLPAQFFVTNANGVANYTFPVSTALDGLSFSFQAITADASQGLFPFNFTAAPRFQVTSLITIVGDDILGTYTFPSGPYTFYGQSFSTIAVSTNGFIKFGTATSSDLSESATDFINGNTGLGAPGPAIAVLWEDLDVGNNPTQSLTVGETSPGICVVSWNNADYFPATPFGTVSCVLDNTSGFVNVTMNYTGYTAVTPPNEGLVGVSAGNSVPATVTAHDLATAGIVNFFAPTGISETVFQSFDGVGTPAIPAQPMDLGGLMLNFLDTTGVGGYTIF